MTPLSPFVRLLGPALAAALIACSPATAPTAPAPPTPERTPTKPHGASFRLTLVMPPVAVAPPPAGPETTPSPPTAPAEARPAPTPAAPTLLRVYAKDGRVVGDYLRAGGAPSPPTLRGRWVRQTRRDVGGGWGELNDHILIISRGHVAAAYVERTLRLGGEGGRQLGRETTGWVQGWWQPAQAGKDATLRIARLP